MICVSMEYKYDQVYISAVITNKSLAFWGEVKQEIVVLLINDIIFSLSYVLSNNERVYTMRVTRGPGNLIQGTHTC